MMNLQLPRTILFLALLGLVTAIGCGQESSTEQTGGHDHDHGHDHHHDHGHRPHSMHEAVAELTEMHDAIRTAILDGKPGKAHDPLHEVGELLEILPDIAAETDLEKEDWDKVKAANEKLFDAFGAIDKTYHVEGGDKKAAYEKSADQINESLELIRSMLPLTGEDPEDAKHSDHGHDGHDHDDHGHDNHDKHDHGDHDDHEGHDHGDHDE